MLGCFPSAWYCLGSTDIPNNAWWALRCLCLSILHRSVGTQKQRPFPRRKVLRRGCDRYLRSVIDHKGLRLFTVRLLEAVVVCWMIQNPCKLSLPQKPRKLLRSPKPFFEKIRLNSRFLVGIRLNRHFLEVIHPKHRSLKRMRRTVVVYLKESD